jgi:AAHS family benzoate transporter-like MFS transporter
MATTGSPPWAERRADPPGRLGSAVTLICWLAVILDGYDLISYGTVVPVLLKAPGWRLDATSAGRVGSAVFVGMLVGALVAGWAGDRFGRRPVALGCVSVFTVFTGCCALAGGPGALGVLRLLAGVGLGGLIPTASALTLEFAPPARRTLHYAVMLSGVPLGGVAAALVALRVVHPQVWQPMFVIGAGFGVLLLPVLGFGLPESRLRRPSGLDVRPPAPRTATAGPTGGWGVLFTTGYRTASTLFAAATFFGLFTWYGLGTWLPGLMARAGYPLGSALRFLLVLSLGAVAGSVLLALATDRWGSRVVVVSTYLGCLAGLLALSVRLPAFWLYAAVAVAGTGAHGGQVLVNAFVARCYPASVRARALGWTLGVGRIGAIVGPTLIGWLVDQVAGHRVSFLAFAGSALAAAALLAIVPVTPARAGSAPSQAAATPETA